MRNSHRIATLLFCFAALAAAQQPSPNSPSDNLEKPRAFITDSQSWEYVSNAGGAAGAFGAHGAGGARPQTAEIVKTFGERCPGVITNNKIEKSDYVVVLDHEGGKGVLWHKNKVAVFNRISGDSIVSRSTLSLGGSVQDACEAISKDWPLHAKEIRSAEAPTTVPDAKLVPASSSTVAASGPPVVTAQPNSTSSVVDSGWRRY